MPGINIYEFFILIGLALILLGPERLPKYAETLARWARKARDMADDAKVRFKEETGTDFDEVDWQRYDPRQYDPRRIIRDALAEDYDQALSVASDVRRSVDPREIFGAPQEQRAGAVAAGVAGASTTPQGDDAEANSGDPLAGEAAPFDAEAT